MARSDSKPQTSAVGVVIHCADAGWNHFEQIVRRYTRLGNWDAGTCTVSILRLDQNGRPPVNLPHNLQAHKEGVSVAQQKNLELRHVAAEHGAQLRNPETGLSADVHFMHHYCIFENVCPCTALLVACICGSVTVVKQLLALADELAVNVHAEDEAAFLAACENGHFEIVRELLNLTGDRAVDVHAGGESAFSAACGNGHLAVVRELLALTGERCVDVHADDEAAFRRACQGGHVDVVRELLALTGDRYVDVHAGHDGGLQAACAHKRANVVRELLALDGDREHTFTWFRSVSPSGSGPEGNGIQRWFVSDEYDTCVQLLQLAPMPFALDRPVVQFVRGWTQRRIFFQVIRGGVEFVQRMQQALQRCSQSQAPQLAQQLSQQVLMHALQHAHTVGRFTQFPVQYCALLAALPAAECAPLWLALQRSDANSSAESTEAQDEAQGDQADSSTLQPKADPLDERAPRKIDVVTCRTMREAVWRGVSVPYRPVRRQVDEPGLRQALLRAGRGRAVLHRAAARAVTHPPARDS